MRTFKLLIAVFLICISCTPAYKIKENKIKKSDVELVIEYQLNKIDSLINIQQNLKK